jgi:hypothetical protein
MKYIINENQLGLINESEKLKSIVIRIYEKWKDINKINELTGLPMEKIILLLKDYDMVIDCGWAEELILDIFKHTLLLKDEESLNFQGLDVKLKLYHLRISNALEYRYENKYGALTGYATPYWVGDCILPISNYMYYDMNDLEYDEKVDIDIKIPPRFNNMTELIDWFNNDYIETLLIELEQIIISAHYDWH